MGIKCYNSNKMLPKPKLIIFQLAVTLFLSTLCSQTTFSQEPSTSRSAEEVIAKLEQNFARIKDATADITLEYNLHLFGCTGVRRIKGKGYYKYPDKIKTIMDHTTYFARGNKIRKIDEDGKRFYVKLIDALDFKVGFHPGLITHNFNLSVIETKKDELVLLGIPKPGVLKNVKKVFFYIDPVKLTLKELDVKFSDKRLDGKIVLVYEDINGITVPVGFQGNSALVLANGILVGMELKLRGTNIKLNKNLPAKFFAPGF